MPELLIDCMGCINWLVDHFYFILVVVVDTRWLNRWTLGQQPPLRDRVRHIQSTELSDLIHAAADVRQVAIWAQIEFTREIPVSYQVRASTYFRPETARPIQLLNDRCLPV